MVTKHLPNLCLVAVLTLVSGPLTSQVQPFPRDTGAVRAILRTEDARDGSTAGLAAFREGMNHSDPFIGSMAVRALGRLENPNLTPIIAEGLQSSHSQVRAAAAYALAQAVHTANGDSVARILLGQLGLEADPFLRATILHSLSSLRNVASEVRTNVENSWALAVTDPGMPDSAVLTMARAIESLGRLRHDTLHWSPATLEGIISLSRFGRLLPENSLVAARIRRLAVMALGAADAITEDLAEALLEDSDPGVRRLTITLIGGGLSAENGISRWLELGVNDSVFSVKAAALGVYSTRDDLTAPCGAIRRLAEDDNLQVSFAAIRAMAKRCNNSDNIDFLLRLATGPGRANRPWNLRAQALFGLSTMAPVVADEVAGKLANEPTWELRMYAARSALITGNSDLAWHLVGDEHHNVREAALVALYAMEGHDADSAFVNALAADDYQLQHTATLQLALSPDGELYIPEFILALNAVTAQRKETSRDVRLALLERIEEFGSPNEVAALEPFLQDFDPVVAEKTATIMGTLTGRPNSPFGQFIERADVTKIGDIILWSNVRAELYLHETGVVTIQLFGFDAPTNVSRFVRQAETGFFDGLTFHRVISNFVVQGGSPGANEYAGDEKYTRDEITPRGHWRGTVGLSTRGRDTGDGQLFINLVDNVRLDFDYTIFGEVTGGMELVDLITEGAVIDSVRIVESGFVR